MNPIAGFLRSVVTTIVMVEQLTIDNYQTIPKVSYGPDSKQIMDLYVPIRGESNATFTDYSKVIILLHGGAWRFGRKESMDKFIPSLAADFPYAVIANVNYRLGTYQNPGYPKQIEDIQSAMETIKVQLVHNYTVNTPFKFVFFGASAGAHLSMFYAYKYDSSHSVSAVVNVVGPTDFTDPIYENSLIYNSLWFSFSGLNSETYTSPINKDTSPVFYINSTSAPTISFYGKRDIFIPVSQGERLKRYLNKAGVHNEMYYFDGGHYLDWSEDDKLFVRNQIKDFVKQYF